MYIDQRHLSGCVILDCCGRFDEADHDRFMKTIEELHSCGYRQVVVNLSSLYFLDPKVIGLLHFAHDFFESSATAFSLVSPLSTVRNELNEADVPESIATYSTIYDALHRPHSQVVKEVPLAAAHA